MGLRDWPRFLGEKPAARPRGMIGRDDSPFHDLEEWLIDPSGVFHPLIMNQTMLLGEETVSPDFLSFARQLFKANPIVFACVENRLFLFSQGRFKYRQQREGRPGKLFGKPGLLPLERPWPGGRTSNLLGLAELNVSLGGNAFFALRETGGDTRIRPMRPDWTAIVLGSDRDDAVEAGDLDAEVLGYIYANGGPGSDRDPVTLLSENVAHFMPIPDPEAPWRGMSWLTPLLRDILADKMATKHKERYWQGGGSPSYWVKPDIPDPDEWQKWVELFKEAHEGVSNKFKHVYLQAGVDMGVLGSNLVDSDFAEVQSVGEVRICAAAMVPPSVVSVSKGLQGSSLNEGNYQAAWRQFANGWARPSWELAAGAFAVLVPEEEGAELWYDDRDIPALQEDVKKIAETQAQKAQAARTLVDGGFVPESVVDYLDSDDIRQLEHSGLRPVQVQQGPGNRNGSSPDSDSDEADEAFTAQRGA